MLLNTCAYFNMKADEFWGENFTCNATNHVEYFNYLHEYY